MTQDISEQLKRFSLAGTDREALKYAGTIVIPLLDQVLEDFYQTVSGDSETAQFFADPTVLQHAKAKQKRHWKLLLNGAFQEEYLHSAETVGKTHFRIQLPFDLYLSGYARASAHIQQLFLSATKSYSPFKSSKRAFDALGALTRAFWLDSNLVIDAYFSAQSEEQQRAFSHLHQGMKRMANEDFSRPIPSPTESDFPERFNHVRHDFNDLMHSMRGIINTIKDATVDLDMTATEVNESADSLARRTEAQAATLEQTTRSVANISSSVRASSAATAKTDEVVLSTKRNAENGYAVVLESVKCMREISAASDKISDISGLIDDIAFQTNLLALNAGIEAARAGDAGRGFAVVASEVRNLAHSAASSAKEISKLIAESNERVDHGVHLADKAGSALGSIVADVENAASLSSQLAKSAHEQSTGLAEIAQGLSQLDSVTQENAAMVEQTAAAMSSMQRDTQAMSRLVNGFELGRPQVQLSRVA